MNKNDVEFHYANTVMPVQNAKETANYYKEYFGFAIDILWENPNYACVSRGGISIEFGEGRPEHVGSGACVIQVSDVEAIYKEYKAQVFGSALANKKELIAKRNVA